MKRERRCSCAFPLSICVQRRRFAQNSVSSDAVIGDSLHLCCSECANPFEALRHAHDPGKHILLRAPFRNRYAPNQRIAIREVRTHHLAVDLQEAAVGRSRTDRNCSSDPTA